MNQAEPLAIADSDAALDATGQLALLCKAASDPLRLSILRVLDRDSYGVLDLTTLFAMKQSGMSHHLKILAGAGLVVTRREGNSIFYRRSTLAPNDSLATLKCELFRQVDARETSFQEGLKQVWHERSQASRRFFLENADKFKAQQDLIASFDVYRQPITELLDLSPLPSRQAALEVGPGAGEFLPALSERFQHVLALDNSPQMLAQARDLVEERQLHNVHLVEADTSYLRSTPEILTVLRSTWCCTTRRLPPPCSTISVSA